MTSMITLPHAVAIKEWATVKFTLDLEQDWHFVFDILEGEKPVNLNGKTLHMDIRPEFYHAHLVRRLSTRIEEGGEITVGDPLLGQASFRVPQVIIKPTLDPLVFGLRSYAHTMVMIDDTGPIRTVWRGTIEV